MLTRTGFAPNRRQMCAKKAQPQAHMGLLLYSPFADTATYMLDLVGVKTLFMTFD